MSVTPKVPYVTQTVVDRVSLAGTTSPLHEQAGGSPPAECGRGRHMRRDVMAVMVLQAAVAGPAAAAADEGPAVASQLEEIVVTARRTEETLQRVPISMFAISGEDIAERSLESLSDVGQSVPNLLFGERGASG